MKKLHIYIETSVWSFAFAEERFNAIALLEGYHHQLRIASPKELIDYDQIS